MLVSYDGKAITYDAIGNPTSYMGAAMTWEGRTLTKYVKGGTTVKYSYDASDLRVSKTVNNVCKKIGKTAFYETIEMAVDTAMAEGTKWLARNIAALF